VRQVRLERHLRSRREVQAGFSLVEMLVALSLVAVVATLLSGGIQFGRRAWERVEARSDRAVALAVRETMRDALERAVPYRLLDPETQIAFDGQGERVRFVGFSNPETESGTLQWIEIGASRSANGSYNLEYRASPLGTDTKKTAMEPVVLLKLTDVPRLRYFGAQSENESSQWHGAWRNANRLPALLALEWRHAGRSETLIVDLSRR